MFIDTTEPDKNSNPDRGGMYRRILRLFVSVGVPFSWEISTGKKPTPKSPPGRGLFDVAH